MRGWEVHWHKKCRGPQPNYAAARSPILLVSYRTLDKTELAGIGGRVCSTSPAARTAREQQEARQRQKARELEEERLQAVRAEHARRQEAKRREEEARAKAESQRRQEEARAKVESRRRQEEASRRAELERQAASVVRAEQLTATLQKRRARLRTAERPVGRPLMWPRVCRRCGHARNCTMD